MITTKEFQERIQATCKAQNIDPANFYVASVSNARDIKCPIPAKNPPTNEKYIIRYFTAYNAVVIWNREEHEPSIKNFSLTNASLKKALETGDNKIEKSVSGNRIRKTFVYLGKLEELYTLIKMCR